MTGLIIAAVALFLILVIRTGKFTNLTTLILPLTVTVLTGLADGGAFYFSENERLRHWVMIAMVLSIAFLSTRAALLLLFDWVLKRRFGVTVPQLIRDVVYLAAYITVGLVLVPSLGGEVTGLIATSAVLTIIIGLAFQQTLGNLLAGLALAWEQRLPTGSWVDFNGRLVTVEETGWRSIVLRTKLGDRILVPNADVAAAQVTLLSGGKQPVAVAIRVGLSYTVAPDISKRILLEVARDVPHILTHPEPQVLTVEFSDSSITYECRMWTRLPWHRFEVIDQFLTRSYSALARHGMEVPFPQLTLHQAPGKPEIDMAERRLQALAEAQLFQGLPADALETVARTCSLNRFAPGEAVVHQGDESTALFVVAGGDAVAFRNQREVARIERTEVFGEGAFLTGNQRAATIRAGRESLEVLEISEVSLKTLLEQHPELTEKLAERLAARELEGETLRDETGAMVHPQGIVAHLKRRLSKWVGG